jgi:GNAT superfamily N-acetyltransferase
MNLTFAALPEAGPFRLEALDQTQAVDTEGTTGILAFDEGRLVAGALFDCWTHTSVQIHVFVTDPLALRHGFQQEVFEYLFDVCGRKMVLGVTPSNNARALKFNAHMGFREVFRVADGFAEGVDLVLSQMRREDCRWIDGQQEGTKAA